MEINEDSPLPKNFLYPLWPWASTKKIDYLIFTICDPPFPQPQPSTPIFPFICDFLALNQTRFLLSVTFGNYSIRQQIFGRISNIAKNPGIVSNNEYRIKYSYIPKHMITLINKPISSEFSLLEALAFPGLHQVQEHGNMFPAHCRNCRLILPKNQTFFFYFQCGAS